MMGTTLPKMLARPDLGDNREGVRRYLRTEFDGQDVSWLYREMDGANGESKPLSPSALARWGRTLRVYARKVASILL